ncbi:DUF427 domain-containing protein [Billgrantia gudaonensis]|uniref:Uncharacterized conserved protein, DUF427 family n=1 Tax=Billgrantia gudaonensis TaxID=376427 RepID=A0A1G9BAN9_9GAMM|nr:DUF427 domain-containing protein [Halomonas gudaonensis]SDK36581.1 Uncharacterized conserved protein, DUF427 family [Halomonas gudaonensis]
MIHDPTGRITLHRHGRRVRVWAGETLLADTRNAVELRETGYPDRQYLPRDDVAMQRLVRTDTVTHCPFKGGASYYAIELVGESLSDAAWSYEAPFEAMADIAERLAFDSGKLEVRVE